MLINDAFDIVFIQVASSDDVDLAKTKVVNYQKGLLALAE
jgi:3-hydroxybutyryl-CoA dehydrogenase